VLGQRKRTREKRTDRFCFVISSPAGHHNWKSEGCSAEQNCGVDTARILRKLDFVHDVRFDYFAFFLLSHFFLWLIRPLSSHMLADWQGGEIGEWRSRWNKVRSSLGAPPALRPRDLGQDRIDERYCRSGTRSEKLNGSPKTTHAPPPPFSRRDIAYRGEERKRSKK
jgi:hypothetical protein